jgi:TolA-binding protein
MEHVDDNEEAEAFTTQPPTRGKGKGKGKGKTITTPPEASPCSSTSSFYMEDEKSSVDQIQQEFETKVKHMYQDIIRINKKIDIKIQKINKYLVVKQQLVRKKKQNLVELEKLEKIVDKMCFSV